MDILSARKKAAEARKKSESEKAPPETAPTQELSAAPEPSPASSEAGAAPAAPERAAVADEMSAVQTPALEEKTAEAAGTQQEIEMLSFRLGDEEYAVTVDAVKEVLKNRDLTPVPNAPDYVLGVMALRGPVLPVIDLGKRLGLPPGINNEKTRIIIVSVNDEDAGIRVDRVTGVVKITPEAIRPTPETIEHGAEFLKGIARKNDKLYILLDIEKAFGV